MPGLLTELQQIRQAGQRTPIFQELVCQQLGRAGTALDVDAETDAQERLELAAEFLRRLQAGRAVRGDEVEGFERFLVQVRRLGLDHFDGHDAE